MGRLSRPGGCWIVTKGRIPIVHCGIHDALGTLTHITGPGNLAHGMSDGRSTMNKIWGLRNQRPRTSFRS